jgi:hypothetical protein
MTAGSNRSASRLSYLDEVAAAAWPGSQRGHRPPRTRWSARDLLVAPSAAAPKLLLPAGSRRAAARAARGHGTDLSIAQRLQRQALVTLLRCGLGPLVLRDRLLVPDGDTITGYLSSALGTLVFAAMAITPPRANRKPVLHLVDDHGRSVGFAKVGLDQLTATLVDREAAVLARLDGLVDLPLQPPRPRHHGSWHGLPILVLSPLPIDHTTATPSAQLTTAMRALAGAALDDPSGAADPYPDRMLARAAALADQVAAADQAALHSCRDVLTRLAAIDRGRELAVGSWHGDWSPWNCGTHAGRLYVWDWERAGGPVPLGYDELHYRLQHELFARRVPHAVAAAQCVEQAPQTLAAWGIGAADARLTAALYLGEIGLRYIADGQRAAGGYGGSVETWIVPALADYVATTAL